MRNTISIFVILFFISISSIHSESLVKTAPSNYDLPTDRNVPRSIPKFDKAPVIDGNPNDEIWKKAMVFKDFIQTQPGDNIAASKPTEAYVGYDEKNFYIAFKCWDEKDKVRASLVARDRVFNEDNVRFWLDTYNDQRRAYVIGFNPLGIQQDGIVTENQGTDFNVDIVMESKGMLQDYGWSVEAVIPFKSLRYTAGKGKLWGFNVARNIDRLNDEFDSWVPLPRDNPGFLNQFGKITGLDEIKTERTLEIAPTITFKESGSRVSPTKFSNPPIQPDFGFTIKYQLSPNITLDGAYNPDFADTEADAPVVEVNQRFPIFFQEKRPFFLEGYDVFNTPIQAVYTRQIQNPDVAAKLTGKIGKTSFGFLVAQDEPLSNNRNKNKAYAGIVRIKRDFGKESHWGFIGTSYNFGAKQHNQLAGFDTRIKFNKQAEFSGQIIASTSNNFFYNPITNTRPYRRGNAVSYTYRYNYDGKNYGYGFGGEGTTKDFRADLGFTRRKNTNQFFAFGNLRSEPKPNNFIIRRFVNASFGIRNDFQGRFQSAGSDFNINMSLKGNAEFGFGGFVNKEVLVEDEFGPKRNARQAGAFFGDPRRSAYQGGMFIFAYKSINKRLSVNGSLNLTLNSFDFDFGGGPRFRRVSPAFIANPDNPIDPGTGREFSYDFGTDVKPTDKFSFSLSYNRSKLVRNDTKLTAFDSHIFGLRSTYQFSRFVFVKARIDYSTLFGNVNGQYTFGWTPSPGKALYIGYNDAYEYNGFSYEPQVRGLNQLSRTFFIKFSYLFRKSF